MRAAAVRRLNAGEHCSHQSCKPIGARSGIALGEAAAANNSDVGDIEIARRAVSPV